MKKFLLSTLIITALLLTSCGDNNKDITETGNPLFAEISIENMMFTPQTITIQPNTTVKWTNNDSLDHELEISGLGIDEKLKPTDTFEYKFENKGNFDFICGIHPDMKGLIVVE